MQAHTILDSIVSKVATWHPLARLAVRPILYPFVRWRMKGIAKTLAHECTWLGTTYWKDVEKHGQNAVYAVREEGYAMTRILRSNGIWVVDYKNKTVRTVLDAPEEYRKVGATF